MLRIGEGDTELVRRRQEMRDAASPCESPMQDSDSAERAAIARSGDPSFQVSSSLQ